MLTVPARLLSASTGLSTAAIVANLLLPRADRFVEMPEVARRDVDGLRADLYFRPGEPAPGVVLVLGALREGRRYAPLERVARIVACGYAVLVPELGDLQELVLNERAVEDLVASALALGAQEEVLGGPVGLFGFSLGASLALLAAADGRLRGRVACVAAMGGYFNLVDMLTAATTGALRESRTPVSLAAPSIYAVAASLVSTLPGRDRGPLELALKAQPDDPLHALSQVDAGSLGPQARRALALLANRNPAAVAPLLKSIEGAAATLAVLSPATVVDRIQAPVWVLHDERDRYVPSEQSLLLREAVAGRPNFRFFSVRVLEHTEPALPTLDLARLVSDYLPGLVQFSRFVHGPLAALRKASRRRNGAKTRG